MVRRNFKQFAMWLFLILEAIAIAHEEQYTTPKNWTNVLLLDVYDTTFLVGSKKRCAPSCDPGDKACEQTDLNNDDVTRFGLGQR
jgi:hypothetical protein